jgi:hypothetical protein
MDIEKINTIRKSGKAAKGKQELVDHFTGKKLTLRKAVLSKCYECMNYYADGKVDCQIPSCPLYPFMPYREGEKIVLRKMAEAQKEKVIHNLRKNDPPNDLIAHYNA